MPKLVGLLVIFLLGLIFNLSFLAAPVLAVSCRDSGIGYGPTSFPDQPNGTTMNFQINNQQTLNYLTQQGSEVKFQSEGPYNPQNPIKVGRPTYYSEPKSVNQANFSLTITDYSLTGGLGGKRGEYYGKLTFKPPNSNNFNDFCDNITYTIGSGDLVNLTCTIDSSVPKTLPLDSPLIVRFKADTNTTYDLRVTKNPFALGGLTGVISPNIAASTTTDGYGLGEFPPVQISGNQGDTIRLTIHPQFLLFLNAALCTTDITLNVAASPQSSPPPKTSSTQTGSYSGPITNAASQDCQITLGGQTYSGIQTAIGCVPVEPAGFIQALLSLAIGIGGGIAFLMMVFGAFQMITSAGNPETLKAGQDKLTNAIIGILIIVFSVLLLKIIGVDILGIEGLIK